MNAPFTYNPFDDASGKQLLAFLAQHGITEADVASPDGTSAVLDLHDSGLAQFKLKTGGYFSVEVNNVQVFSADALATQSLAQVQAPSYVLSDGSDKNYNVNVAAVGTAYQLTNASAALTFGTTSPSLVLNKAGTYLLLARVNLKYNAATFAASRAVTLKFRRTNNTPADLTGGTKALATDIITTKTFTFDDSLLPPIVYTTTNVNDAITIFGDVATVPTAGSLDAVEANIQAVRLF